MDAKRDGLPSRSLNDALQERLNEAKTSSTIDGRSEYLVHRRIRLKPHHSPTGKTKHHEGTLTSEGLERGSELPPPQQLMIAQIPPDQGYYLFYLDHDGNEITDTHHDNLEAALAQAEWEFSVKADEWEI